jgi:hypothetical protein
MATWRIAFLAGAVALGITILDAAAAPRASEWSAQSTQRTRPRVEIRPGRLYYRQCVDGLQVSHKYWGRTVLMPYMRCWWVRG